ncbi:hypothetical protein BHM03_00014045 [Ensete ventricosum]|nr:hypothetical protein BHM03_00014045 [Ensete ventricosum]
MRPLSSLLLTIPSHLTTSSVVIAARRTPSSLQLGDVNLAHLILVRSVVRRDLAERVTSGINPEDLAERVNSGTNPGDLVERVNSGTNPRDLAQRVNSGTNLGDLAEKVNSGTNPGNLAEKVNSGTNPRDLVEMKKVKVLMRRHKSQHGEGGSRSHSKGKEPVAPYEEPETLVESDEGDASLVHHCPRFMKDLFKTKVYKEDAGYYALHMSNLGHQDPDKEMKARWGGGLKNSTKVWNDSSTAEKFKRGLLHPQLARELYTFPSEVLLARAAEEMVLELDALKSGGDPEAIDKAEERASELEQELEKTKRERDEVLQRLEASEKELNEVWSNLAKIQRLLKEARVRARKMDDELLQSVKALQNARAELPRQAVDRYKESTGFKEGLKRMGRVTYEYGYRVALARFHALHPDSEVEEDPFTIHPEDDLVPIERQQAFDDSDPLES